MKKVESYASLNGMIMKQFRRGMVTNSFLAREEYEREISGGRLYCIEAENGLLLLRRRETHAILSFWLNDGAVPDKAVLPGNTVLEIPHRERDTALLEMTEKWKTRGFELEFCRQRMIFSDSAECYENDSIRAAEHGEEQLVKELLCESFSPLTGCIPTGEALSEDIKNGGVLLYVADGEAFGLLHFTKEKKKTELRHLCVSEKSRGHGIAKSLVCRYNALTNGLTRQVWVRCDNAPAVKIYETCGYRTDGMTSDVLILR